MHLIRPFMATIAFVAVSLPLTSAPLSDSSLLAEHLISHQYEDLQATLERDARSMVEAMELDQPIEITEGETRLRMLLLSTLNQLPVDRLSDPEWNTPHRPFLSWLFSQPDCLALLSTQIRSEDHGDRVLAVWSQIWQSEPQPEFRKKYANLALALALLYDSSHALKKSAEENYYPSLTLSRRYEYFRDASEDQKLVTPCHRMSVRDLVRVVDTNISLNEIAWVHKNVSGSRKKAGNAYSEIEYLMERAVDGINPYDYYILSEIKKHGGICGDQAHYASNIAKVRGIPAMTIVGTGDRGPHAWIAYMPKDHLWETHGRQGITNGKTFCAQRAENISFRQLDLEGLKDYTTEEREPVMLHLVLARQAIEVGSFDSAAKLIEQARKLADMNLEIWTEEQRLLEKSGASAELWGRHFDQFERTFEDYSHVLEQSLERKVEHLFAQLPEEERLKFLEKEVRSLARELGSEENALITVIDRIGGILVDQDDAEEVKSFYSRSFRRYGEDLEMFTKIQNSYLRQGAKLPELAPEVPDELLKAFKRVAETNSKELFRAQMELSILRKIAKSFAKLKGTEAKEKAADLRKDINKRQERIDRAAL